MVKRVKNIKGVPRAVKPEPCSFPSIKAMDGISTVDGEPEIGMRLSSGLGTLLFQLVNQIANHLS